MDTASLVSFLPVPLKKLSQGDDLLRVAQREGVSSQAIASHPDNQDLLAARDPAVLHEKDELFVPAPEPKRVTVATGYTHYLVYKPPTRTLHLQLRDDDGSLIETDYTLTLRYDPASPVQEPVTLYGYAYQGVVNEQLSGYVVSASLLLETKEPILLELAIAHLDPVSTNTGLLARLRLLGLYLGPLDESTFDHDVIEALRLFQIAQRLPVTGHADPNTRTRLVAVCGK